MSFPGPNRRAWDIYGPSYTNPTLPSEDPHYGNVRKVSAAGQLGKRTRSSSNEDSNSRLSQVQAWLKDQASAEDFDKVWRIFLESKAPSATETYEATDQIYQGSLEDIDIVPDIPAHSSISADPASASELALSGEFSQYPNFVAPKSLIHDYSMNSSIGQPSTLSMVSPSERNSSTLPARSRDSLHSEPCPAVAETGVLLRQSLVKSKQDKTRDSVQSTSSYNSMNSDMSMRWSTKHSSTSSLGGQSISSVRKPSQKPMHMSIKKSHSRSSSTSRTSNSIQPSDIPCSYSEKTGCTRTFTRDPDRKRHEDVFHINKVVYTCLLHTCAESCSEACSDRIHNFEYSNGRRDKMKEHLEKVHNLSYKVNDIPDAFRHSYKRQQKGWVCKACGDSLGNWYDDRDNIEGHETICEAVLQASFKRMSVEEQGIDGAREGGDMGKGGPLPDGTEGESCQWF